MRWAYGVTTVPQREKELLPQTLASLKAAGFDTPTLFVDGISHAHASAWEQQFGLPIVSRNPVLRVFGNWILALAELYIHNPTAERFAIFQDDFVTYRNLRQYLEKCKYPEHGYWNLYTFPSNQGLAPEGGGWFLSNQFGRGAVALVFDLAAVLVLLSHPHMIERPMDPTRGWKKVDGGIVTAMTKAGYREWVHSPSLVQHVGQWSTCGNKPHKQATSFKGEGFDALELLK